MILNESEEDTNNKEKNMRLPKESHTTTAACFSIQFSTKKEKIVK